MTPKQQIRYSLVGILIVVLAFAGMYRQWHHVAAKPRAVKCPDTLHTCEFTVNQRPVRVDFVGAPAAMHPFTLEVRTPDAQQVTASFTMPDMDMGKNDYRLIRKSAQLWQAQIVLPVCMRGGHDRLLGACRT